MLKVLVPAAAFALLAASTATAQSTLGPTPNEQNGIHTGTTATNGSAVIVTDQFGTHPEGYPGMAVRNRASGSSASEPARHHRRHHRAAATSTPN